MKYFGYRKENKEIVVTLHGDGVSYWSVEPTIQMVAQSIMQSSLHIISSQFGALRDTGMKRYYEPPGAAYKGTNPFFEAYSYY